MALLAALLILVAWPASLMGRDEHLIANIYRTGGALLLALGAWMVRPGSRRRAHEAVEPGWKSLVVAGLIGSLLITGVAALVPALGNPWVSGWLVSGVVGGGCVALVSFATYGR